MGEESPLRTFLSPRRGQLGPDSAAPGASIVIEAKENDRYTLKATLEEADEARRNRSASVCLFVHSAQTAPSGMPELHRWGNDIVVVWDADDPNTDARLKAGLLLAKALAVRVNRHDDESLERIMQSTNGHLLLSPSDLNDYVNCRHLTTLVREVARGEREAPHTADEAARLLQEKGELHELQFLERLHAEGREVSRLQWTSVGTSTPRRPVRWTQCGPARM